MIVANLATYPPRAAFLPTVLARIAPQVDVLNLVLNEYSQVPGWIAQHDSVVPVIPDHDTKDAGKFFPDISGAEHVFFIDDDILYPEDFVARSLERMAALGEGRFLGGYHCSIYRPPPLALSVRSLKSRLRYMVSPNRIAGFRTFYHFGVAHDRPIYVDQVATNAALMRARDVPPYSYMRSSRKFVDVRLARWCFEQGIARVSLPRAAGWLQLSNAAGVVFEETIAESFTNRHHDHVAREIRSYAFRDPRVGATL